MNATLAMAPACAFDPMLSAECASNLVGKDYFENIYQVRGRACVCVCVCVCVRVGIHLPIDPSIDPKLAPPHYLPIQTSTTHLSIYRSIHLSTQDWLIFSAQGISCGGGFTPADAGSKQMIALTLVLMLLVALGTLWCVGDGCVG